MRALICRMAASFFLAILTSLCLPVTAFAQVYTDRSRGPAPLDERAVTAVIGRQMQSCWRVPKQLSGQSAAVRVRLLGSGVLDGDPVHESGNPTLARTAIRAIIGCAPYQELARLADDPQRKFEIVVTFVP